MNNLFMETDTPAGSNIFDYKPTSNLEHFYKQYDKIVGNVNDTLESVFSTIYNTYQGYLKFKSLNSVDYEKMVNSIYSDSGETSYVGKFRQLSVLKSIGVEIGDKGKDEEDSSEYRFYDFFEVFKTVTGGTDIHMAMNPDSYIEEVARLRLKFYNTNDCDVLFFDLEKNVTTKAIRNDASIGFKIKPYIKNIISDTNSDQYYINTKFGIHLDYEALADYIIYQDFNIRSNPDNLLPTQSDGELDKESYVTQMMTTFSSLAEQLTRVIYLELLAVHNTINTGYPFFIKKFMKELDRGKTDNQIIHLSGKLNHYLKKVNKSFIILNTDILTKDIINTFQDSTEFREEEGTFYEDLHSVLSNLGRDSDEELMILTGRAFFKKIFTHYFENEVALSDTSFRMNSFNINSYQREFNNAYNKDILLTTAGSINDYNIRDFYKTIVNGFGLEHIKCDRKQYNGENKSFMFSKLRRDYILKISSLYINSFYIIQQFLSMTNIVNNQVLSHCREHMEMVFKHLYCIMSESGLIFGPYPPTPDREDDTSLFMSLYRINKFLKSSIETSRRCKCLEDTKGFALFKSLIQSYYKRYINTQKQNSYYRDFGEIFLSYNTSDVSFYMEHRGQDLQGLTISDMISRLKNFFVSRGLYYY